jgi:hypothetical protein
MCRSRTFPSLLLSLLLTPVPCVRAESDSAKTPDASKSPRVDLYGDPLPDGALARFGTIRFRSGSHSLFAVLSPDGKLIALNRGPDSVQLMDSTTGLIHRQIVLSPPIGALAASFSPDGTLLATINMMGGIELHGLFRF